jgi:hypothetical protein
MSSLIVPKKSASMVIEDVALTIPFPKVHSAVALSSVSPSKACPLPPVCAGR